MKTILTFATLLPSLSAFSAPFDVSTIDVVSRMLGSAAAKKELGNRSFTNIKSPEKPMKTGLSAPRFQFGPSKRAKD